MSAPARLPDDDMVLPFKVWVPEYAGISESADMRSRRQRSAGASSWSDHRKLDRGTDAIAISDLPTFFPIFICWEDTGFKVRSSL